uniref:Uncharacterized protein n=1 Tax=Hyaloperonospora arabidopsidis (strain Emoy2) TaxID=559515 RepID=M4BD29_HYAAE
MTDPNNIIQEQLGEFQEMSNDLRKNADAIKVTSGEENNKEDYTVALELSIGKHCTIEPRHRFAQSFGKGDSHHSLDLPEATSPTPRNDVCSA